MGYSNKTSTLLPILPFLLGIARGESEVVWKTSPGGTKRWAYRIREAKYILNLHPDAAPAYAAQINNYRFLEEPELDRVIAKRRFPVSATVAPPIYPAAPPAAARESIRKPAATLGKQTARSIIGGLIGIPVSQPLHFPEAELSAEDLAVLAKWAQAQEPRLMVLSNPPALTLAPYDPSLED